jgi:hypothetical protein
MQDYYRHLKFDGFHKRGRFRGTLEMVCSTFERYQDPTRARLEGVNSCWITEADSGRKILGAQPTNWSPDHDVYQNGAS